MNLVLAPTLPLGRNMSLSLSEIISPVSDRGVKHWLKVKGYDHKAHDKIALLDSLQSLINGKVITQEDIEDAVLDLEEHGGKRVYLGHIEKVKSFVDKSNFVNHLKKMGLSLSSTRPKTIRRPDNPTINYINWSKEEIRIKFTETHKYPRVDENFKPILIPVNRIIIISAEPKTGFVNLLTDPSQPINPHLNGRGRGAHINYEKHYFDQTVLLLGGGFKTLDLSSLIEKLVALKPMIFLPKELGLQMEGSAKNDRVTFKSQSNVVDNPLFKQAIEEYMTVAEATSGDWLAEQSNGKLLRQFFMEVSKKHNRIRFPAYCLASEVDYVLTRIKSLQN